MLFVNAIICRIAFGKRYEEEGTERSRIYWLIMETQALDIFMAGTDPSATTMTLVVTHLMKYPSCDKRNIQIATDRSIISATRLRTCNIGGYKIPAKTEVHVNAWAVGRDLKVWENPEEFYLERFIGSSIDYKGLDFQLISFGASRRRCHGIDMGVVTVELALANLLYKFDWEMPVGMNNEDIDFDVISGFTVHKKNALCLRARQIII
ncbi:hypothetical protein PTKIN_Ptkin06aG0165700 [Pterospermum kingtungense]